MEKIEVQINLQMQGRGEKDIVSLTVEGFKTETPRAKGRVTEEKRAYVLDVILYAMGCSSSVLWAT